MRFPSSFPLWKFAYCAVKVREMVIAAAKSELPGWAAVTVIEPAPVMLSVLLPLTFAERFLWEDALNNCVQLHLGDMRIAR